jgi:hypothetical protein
MQLSVASTMWECMPHTAGQRSKQEEGGVLQATFPGLSQTSIDQWADTWYWSFIALSAHRLFAEKLPENVEVQFRRNALTAAALLRGLAGEELMQQELDHCDSHYQTLTTVRTVKPERMQE